MSSETPEFPVIKTNSSKKNPSTQQRITPKPGPTLAEYEQKKKDRLNKLKKQSRENKLMFDQLSAHARNEELTKAKRMAETNPLRIDEAENYTRNLGRLKRKYRLGKY